jgi:hypothetical protein
MTSLTLQTLRRRSQPLHLQPIMNPFEDADEAKELNPADSSMELNHAHSSMDPTASSPLLSASFSFEDGDALESDSSDDGL